MQILVVVPNSYASESHRDTVLVNGQILRITASVVIDTVSAEIKKTPFWNWMDDADFMAYSRVGAEIGAKQVEGNDFYRVKDNSNFGEVGFGVCHPYKESFQLYYTGGVSLGIGKKFYENEVDLNAIGFNWTDGELIQIITVLDPLQNELDTLSAPIHNRPLFKLSLGSEWHGVMRGARGWVWGGQIEWFPLKSERAFLYRAPDNPNAWDNVLWDSTFDLVKDETNSFQFRAYTSWSPWNFSWFIKAEICWSPNVTSSAVSLGYIW
ncbi:MAG: hypothetical protein COA49_06135 [Bacteroidetes bacterium]|nr:MAG: hypothetical protein COA49_06135 [Bacteroidota bacterium]